MHCLKLPHRYDVQSLVDEIAAHPEVWNQHPYRSNHPASPHREVDDIWVRFNPDLSNLANSCAEHTSAWYSVVRKLPSVLGLVEELRYNNYVATEPLGAVLITRIPPGKMVYPHIDPGWQAKFYRKYAIQLMGNKGQEFCFRDPRDDEPERLQTITGESFWFENQVLHWVTNETDEPRMTMIVCAGRR